ncbi:DUF5107 domain-containing protein [Halobacillus shinanisalinarum]|uniref:DUF5107 domain-containing protein n=1 Tax=Halobacillus shinanisalinarum TaxID=2932258 RepID=A0ABY4H309_9BACI|nr:DUF5107 domain-containing protein [Halobacillus shinanisalinarum]UOQ94843.1 DUF5107 domain-containing protein [Halobacillus shinanisalinarum]
MIKYGTFKGIDSIILENEHIRCTILPAYGGKMASLFDKKAGYEWLYQTEADKMTIPTYGQDFSKFDSSGFDEMFPGIDEGPHPHDFLRIPDHGEVWAMPWQVTERSYGLDLEVSSPVFPYSLKKQVSLKEDRVELNYQAINLSNQPFPFIWAAHSLLNMNQTTTIRVPSDLSEVINVEQASDHLGEWGTVHRYPVTQSRRTGDSIDLSKMEDEKANNIEKFYFTKRLSQGWCQAVQNNIGRTLTYTFPSDKVPYLGIWKTQGGYRSEYNFALEPCTGMYDDVYVANKINKVSKIPARGTYSWDLTMQVGGL